MQLKVSDVLLPHRSFTRNGILWIKSILLILLRITTCSGQMLSITPHGTQIKTIDSGMIFTCTIGAGAYDSPASASAAAADASTPGIKWLAPRRQEITATAGRVYIERPDKWNLRLYITRIQEADAGLYTCLALLEPGKEWIVEETRMFLYEDIRFSDTRTEVRSLLGTSALLECMATGQPEPEVTWRFNRRRIVPEGEKYVLEEEGLRINQLELKDNGTYECRAEVESHGNVKIRNVNLEVIYAPVILQSPTAEVVIKGQETKLDCRADGNPPVLYEWFREQKMSEMIRVKVRLAEGTPTYIIQNVGSDDEGRYFCRTSNYLGTKEAYVDIRMLVPPEINPLPEKVSVAEGKSINITCEATGIPLPKITWKLSTDELQGSTELHQVPLGGGLMERTQPGRSSLTIRNTNRSHAGILTCAATSTAGTASRDIEIMVEYPPSIEMGLTEQLGWSGQTRAFSCTGRGIPLPSINWFRGEQYISDNDIYRITTTKTNVVITSALTIVLSDNVPWAYGGYSCIAKNVHGYVTKDIRLTEATAPDMVRNVSVEKETPTSVTLTATAPSRTGGLPITSWMVTYELESAPGGRSNSHIFRYGESLHVTNLTAGSGYTFYLSASNAVGFSQPVKFRVTTPRRLTLKEQSDVPERDVNVSFQESLSSVPRDRVGSDQKPKDRNRTTLSISPSAESDHAEAGRGFNSAAGEAVGGGARSGESVLLAIAIGSTVVLTAVMVALVCVLWWRKRRKAMRPQWYVATAAGSAQVPVSYRSTESAEYFLGRPTENCVMLLPAARQPTDPLPAVVALVDPEMTSQPEAEVMASADYLQRMNAALTLPMMKSRTPTGTRAGTPKQQVVDRGFMTLQRCESGRVAMTIHPGDEDSTTQGVQSASPLYMLQAVGGGQTRPAAGKSGQQAGGKAGPVGGKSAIFIDEILDGYHSGDNVDDDIDKVDYTIKIPSFHGQVK